MRINSSAISSAINSSASSSSVKRVLAIFYSIIPFYAAIKFAANSFKEGHFGEFFAEFSMAAVLCFICLSFFEKYTLHRETVRNLDRDSLEDSETRKNSILKIGAKATKVRVVDSESEVREIWRIDEQVFGEETISVERGIHWWKKTNRKCLYVIRGDDEVLGYMSIWSITRDLFDALRSGSKNENDIDSADLEQMTSDSRVQYWYIGSLVCKHDNKFVVSKLTFKSLWLWQSQVLHASEINVCSNAFSDEGEKFLKRFGFSLWEEKGKRGRRFSLYSLTITPAKLAEKLNPEFRKRAKIISS